MNSSKSIAPERHVLFALCVDFLPDDIDFFFKNESLYKSMFKLQGNDYWIKYVITLRDRVYYKKFTNILDADEFDYIFIDLLKRLVTKNHQGVIDFIANICKIHGCNSSLPNYREFVVKQDPSIQDDVTKIAKSFFDSFEVPITVAHMHNIYNILISCACALIRLLHTWLGTTEGDKLNDWSIPQMWRLPVSHSSPFESFLRSRWGGDIMKILNISKDICKWWRAPSKPPKTECWCKPMKEHVNKRAIERNTLGWLPVKRELIKPLDKNHRDESFFSTLEASVDIHKWNFYEVAFGTILHPKYHSFNITDMICGQDDKYHMGVGPWYAAWNAGFGYQMPLSFLQCSHEISEISKKDNSEQKTAEWIYEMKLVTSLIEETLNIPRAPRPLYDCMNNPGEFLLEPYVIVKLPWQPVLLQHWLSVALIEIMKFELETLELRHWVIPREISKQVCDLLHLIADAKERILLGLLIHAQETIAFPELSDTFPYHLIQYSIAFCLPALKFLTSGAAYEILKDLKAIAFEESRGTDSETYEQSVCVPKDNCRVENELETFYSTHYWHIYNWLDKNNIDALPMLYCKENFDVEGYMDIELSAEYGIEWCKYDDEITSVPYSLEEDLLREHFAKFDFKVAPKDRVCKTFEIIKEFVFQKSIFPHTDWEVLMNKVLVTGAQVTNLYTENNKMAFTPQLVLYGMLYNNMSKVLSGIDTRDSVLACLVRLSGEIIERQQIVRIAHVCSQVLKKCPVLLETEGHVPRSSSEIQDIINSAFVARKNINLKRCNLLFLDWLPFSKEYLENINLNEECPNIADGIDSCVSKFQARLRRLMLNVYSRSFTMWETNCNIFPHIQETEYIMPCYISSLCLLRREPETKRNRKKIQNFVKLLHGLMTFYEKMFYDWRDDYKNKRISTLPMYTFDNIKSCSQTMLQKLHVLPSIQEILNTFVCLGSGHEGFPGFLEAAEALTSWPRTSGLNTTWTFVESMTVMAWEYVSMKHSLLLYKVCPQVFELPPTKSDFGDSLLEKAYFTCAVIQKIFVLISVQTIHYKFIHSYTEFEKFSSHEIEQRLGNLRLEIMTYVAETAGLIHKEVKDNNEMNKSLEVHLATLNSFFNLMCTIRLKMGCNKMYGVDFLDDDASCVKNAVALFVTNKLVPLSKLLGFQIDKNNVPTVKISNKSRKKLSQEKAEQESVDQKNPKQKNADQKDHELHNDEPPSSSSNLIFIRKCRKCRKVESKKKSLIACQQCLTSKYPDVNYFCNKECEDAWWEEEHMAEHLEFELGLGDFSAHTAEELNT